MRTLILLSLLLISKIGYAQLPPTDTTEVFTIVEQLPSFPGGESAMMEFVYKNIHYPQHEMESGIQGTVFLQFVINREGHIENVKVLKGIPGGPGCDNEAVRVIKQMPQWIPGKQGGKAVSVAYNLPVRFILK